MIRKTLMNYRIRNKTVREQYNCYLEEIKRFYRSWNVPDDAIDRIIRYSETNEVIREKERTSYGKLEEHAKTIMRVFCEPHIIDLPEGESESTETEYDDAGDAYQVRTLTEYVDGEFNGQKLWYPKTMYVTEDDNGKLSFYEDTNLQARNDRRLIDVYRAVNGLLTSCEIKAFCDSVSISGRTLSLLLGWEIDAIDRYCNDTIQSEDRNRTLTALIENRDLLLGRIEAFDDDMVDMDEDELIAAVASIYGLSYVY